MKLLILTTHFNHGGITSYIINLAKGLKNRGHHVIVGSSGGSCLKRLEDLGVSHINIPIRTKSELSPKVMISFLKLISFLREKDIQIIHSQTRVTQVLGAWLSFFGGIPFVSTCHGFFKPRLSRKIFPCWGKYVIAISQPVKEHLVNDLKVKERCVKVIYHGIDSERFKLYVQERPKINDSPVVGIIARLSDVKGHQYLIRAFKKVLAEIPHAKLLIIGEGPLKKELENLTRELNIEKSVSFMPPVDDSIRVLSLMDIFVMPSVKEGLGLSIMEAQAAGLPVVAFDVGAISNLIKNEETGILVNFADTEALAQAILSLIKDKQLAQRISQNAQQFIREKFPLEKMVEKTEEVYEESIS
jgi:glycosyltransferase involved in cell wall biosynthesis